MIEHTTCLPGHPGTKVIFTSPSCQAAYSIARRRYSSRKEVAWGFRGERGGAA